MSNWFFVHDTSDNAYADAYNEFVRTKLSENSQVLDLDETTAESYIDGETTETTEHNLGWLPDKVFDFPSIKKLSASGNDIDQLSPRIGTLINLEELNLSYNQISTLPVEIWQLSLLTSLDLSNNGLTILPAEIGQLTNLTSLNLSGNQLASLPAEIGKLTALTKLDLSGNQLTTLPVEIWQLTSLVDLDLSDNQLTTLSTEIGHLNQLKWLNLRDNQFVVLPIEIRRLTSLAELDLSSNQLTALPGEIGQLVNLTSLDIVNNLLSALPIELGQLTRLTMLDVSINQLKALPAEIGHLTNLEILFLVNNGLAALPAEVGQLKNLKKLDLRGNPLEFPPEILEKVDKPQTILSYLSWIFEGKRKPICETKILMVGQGSVGKTSLVRRLTAGTFDAQEVKTEGIAIEHWQVANQTKSENQPAKIQLNIWDFGGQEIMHATHQFFLTRRSLYLLVLDARNTQEQNQVEYWLKIIQSFSDGSPVLIVGNKIDQHPLDIDRTGLQKKYLNIIAILETSAATGAGIYELKAAIAEQTNSLPHVRDLLPESWFAVKTRLEGLGRESNFITHDRYIELCTENKVGDEISQRTLIGFLHDLGVVLHFQDDLRLEALGILNPQWVTNGVYKILNSHVLFQNKGVLTISRLDEILNLPEYPRGKRLFIVDMMKKFELCYDLEPDKAFLVPDLLPKDEPVLDFRGVPAFEYLYPVLPTSVMTRFIVRMNQHIHEGQVWRSGVLLQIGQNQALVKADGEDRTVRIAIDGLEHTRRDALAAIRYELDSIHASIKELKPQKRVPVSGALNAEPLEYEYLLMLEREGQETHPVKDGNRLVKVNIRQLLSGIESEDQRKENAQYVTNIYNVGNIIGSKGIAIGQDVQAAVSQGTDKADNS